MKRLIGTIGDRLQAIFPPNRIMLVLAGPITAGSIWLSAWITANVPGVALPVGVIAGAMGVVGLIVVTLIYKWFDQWQKQEPIDVEGDLEAALDEFIADPAAAQAIADLHPGILAALVDLSPLADVGKALEGLSTQAAEGKFNGQPTTLSRALAGLDETLRGFVGEHLPLPVAPASSAPAPPPPGPVDPPVPPAAPAPPTAGK